MVWQDNIVLKQLTPQRVYSHFARSCGYKFGPVIRSHFGCAVCIPEQAAGTWDRGFAVRRSHEGCAHPTRYLKEMNFGTTRRSRSQCVLEHAAIAASYAPCKEADIQHGRVFVEEVPSPLCYTTLEQATAHSPDHIQSVSRLSGACNRGPIPCCLLGLQQDRCTQCAMPKQKTRAFRGGIACS